MAHAPNEPVLEVVQPDKKNWPAQLQYLFDIHAINCGLKFVRLGKFLREI